MTTIRTATTFGRWRNRRRKQIRQPGLLAKLSTACTLCARGHSWAHAWKQANNPVIE